MIRLYKFSRTKQGLYIIYRGSHGNDYITYHEDGRYWIRNFKGEKHVKKLRQPLSNFRGVESLRSAGVLIVSPIPGDQDENQVVIGPEDIVVERNCPFFIEIMLSESSIELPSLPNRTNSAVYFRGSAPRIVIEIYENVGPTFPDIRYTTTVWVEGQNFFVNHQGKI